MAGDPQPEGPGADLNMPSPFSLPSPTPYQLQELVGQTQKVLGYPRTAFSGVGVGRESVAKQPGQPSPTPVTLKMGGINL